MPFYACSALLAILNYGGLNWFPTHMIRNFDMTPARAGAVLGAIQLGGSIAGTVIGAMLTEHFQRRTLDDAHLRTVAITPVGAAIGLVAPLIPTIAKPLALWSLALVSLGTSLL